MRVPPAETEPTVWATGTEPLVISFGDDDALVFTMRDLNQQAARIMNEIEKIGQPAFITKHGRFVAIITPLAPGQVESRVLAEMAREIASRGRG
jgi:antitoxin (DNA-binding transcriptional repressor) of toxin-antitoxin stability system